MKIIRISIRLFLTALVLVNYYLSGFEEAMVFAAAMVIYLMPEK